jgi:hypothetical protein
MKKTLEEGRDSVEVGFCCIFSDTIPPNVKSSLVIPPKAPCISTFDAESSDTSFDEQYHPQPNKQLRGLIKRCKALHASSVNFLSDYFDDPSVLESLVPPDIHATMHSLNMSRKKSRKPRFERNIIQGSLVFPEFDLVIQADATNNHLNCDHMALAESPIDNTKAVMHGVVNTENAEQIKHYIKEHSLTVKRISGKKERISINVTSPEDATRTCNMKLDIITVDQLRSHREVSGMKASSEFELGLISNMMFFSCEDIE